MPYQDISGLVVLDSCPHFHRFPQGLVHKGMLATFYGSFSR